MVDVLVGGTILLRNGHTRELDVMADELAEETIFLFKIAMGAVGAFVSEAKLRSVYLYEGAQILLQVLLSSPTISRTISALYSQALPCNILGLVESSDGYVLVKTVRAALNRIYIFSPPPESIVM
jgi:hypothetical protein